MGIDFDILEHCKKVRADHGPPYTCPVDKCGRTYKSVCGLQYHLKSYDHDNPTPLPPSSSTAASSSGSATPSTPRNNKKGRGSRATPSASAASKALVAPNVPEPLTYEEAQKMVQFQVGAQTFRWNINDPLDVVAKEDLSPDEDQADGPENKAEQQPSAPPVAHLPEASFKEITTYNICDAPPRPNAYIRFIEKSTEELDGEVEYDVDEEDTTWLGIMNQRREAAGLSPVSVDSLELLMDRLEKESYFQASVNGQAGTVVDDDAVCCICMDGECQNTNVILFCDMCNLAVHQDCYGVPYIPEGQWLCRRCLQSPSRAVDCVLCPNQGGAFKQTDRGHWAHVVCALWIPEVRFANTVFLEPIDSIETIPAARWRLTCYVCKQRGVGACIQCHKTNCYSAFHVTCAQQAGLYMKMDTVKDSGGGSGDASQPVLVQKMAFCDVHAPAQASAAAPVKPEEPQDNINADSKKEDSRQKIMKARKMLAKKRTSAPVILIPTIPPERIQEIGSLVTITKKSQFIQRLIAYWTLKRQYRNGVPLLRRLQSAQGGQRDSATGNVDLLELCRQLKYWQCLRQDLERARLLCELVRKREKIKLEQVKVTEKLFNIKLKPLQASLRNVLDMLAAKDTNEIFSEPVDLEEVPDYTTVVTDPMDLSTMRKKLDQGLYPDLTAMEKDFDLMIANCLAYNNRDTVFYRAGIKMRDQCGAIFRQARKELEACGLLDESKRKNCAESSGGGSGHSTEESLATDIDKELESFQGKKPDLEMVRKLEELLTKSQALKHGLARAKRVKLLRSELNKARRLLVASSAAAASTEEEEDEREGDSFHRSDAEAAKTQKNTKNSNNVETDTASTSAVTAAGGEEDGKNRGSASPGVSPSSGVNRRTAILLTRKSQSTPKKPAGTEDDKETSTPSVVAKSKKKGRGKRSANNTRQDGLAVAAAASSAAVTLTSPSSIGTPIGTTPKKSSILDSVPDSFKMYRAPGGGGPGADHQTSDGEHSDSSGDDSLSTCYSRELSEVESEDDDSDVDVVDSSTVSNMSAAGVVMATTTQTTASAGVARATNEDGTDPVGAGGASTVAADKMELMKPLQLVWAKCRGYPWYPALIIDPKMPTGFVHKGVPLPTPPAEVMALRTNHANVDQHVYLVLFFDAKRTWQWLPAEKLEIMGVDRERDEAKANEPRKPTDRKAVKKAYENALQYQLQVSSTADEEGEDIETA